LLAGAGIHPEFLKMQSQANTYSNVENNKMDSQ